MKKKIPVIVVSGFLGSGKTTFLRYLLKKSNKKFGLIINEFGDVGIDGDLIKSCVKCDESEESEEGCVIELNNGCLCCTVQDDFVPSIKALLEFNPLIESIIIETSGLALPIPLIQALNWPEIRNQQDLNLEPDIHGQDISGNEYVKFDLNGFNFSESNLEGAVFNNSKLQNSKFNGANLRDALAYATDFTDADLSDVNFTNALLMESNFEGAKIDGADFTDAVLSRTQQKQLCAIANGKNSSTGESTEYSLGC